MAEYYKTIDGVKYDRGLLEVVDKAVAGRGDGRISLDDAKMVLAAVKDGNSYTDVEKATVKYVRDKYQWTKEADEWFRKEINMWNWAGHK